MLVSLTNAYDSCGRPTLNLIECFWLGSASTVELKVYSNELWNELHNYALVKVQKCTPMPNQTAASFSFVSCLSSLLSLSSLSSLISLLSSFSLFSRLSSLASLSSLLSLSSLFFLSLLSPLFSHLSSLFFLSLLSSLFSSFSLLSLSSLFVVKENSRGLKFWKKIQKNIKK